MQVLDWRSPGERVLTSLWRTSADQTRLRPGRLGVLYNGVHDHVMARRIGARSVPVAGPLVVSIGNLALGGTGKTPVAIALARDLSARGVVGCVLTRGFRSPLPGPLKVSEENERAGDEARLLAAALADCGWPVVQARKREAGLRHILGSDVVPQVVLLEDGHQTAVVGRHCDVLILDHWQIRSAQSGDLLVPETGAVFPFGPWRESAGGALRADIWVVETNQLLPTRGVGGSRVVTFTRKVSLRPANAAAKAAGKLRRPGLVSGIARPARFEAGVQDLLPAPAVVAVRLPDHAPYSRTLLRRLERALVDAGFDGLVTTGKDWVKLAGSWSEAVPAFVAELEIVWGQGETLTDLIGERLAALSAGVASSPR